MARENRNLDGGFPRLIHVAAASVAGVFAFGVLADDHPVQVSDLAVAERGLSSAEDFGGAYIGVLLQGLADGEAEAP